MKIGRLITVEGIEFNLDSSQLAELTEYLHHQQINDAIALDVGVPLNPSGFIDPEEYERAAQAAYFVRQAKALPAAA